MDQIIAHPWMQGPTASPAEVHEEFKERKACVDQDAHEKREQKRADRRAVKNIMSNVEFRSVVNKESSINAEELLS